MRAAVAVALLAGLAACSGGVDADEREPDPGAAAATATAELFAGIPQDGVALGSPSAPVTLTEFVDLRCGHCRNHALRVLPVIIQRYVRPGQVRIVFRNLAFLGPGSRDAARTAAAVGLQGKLWQFVDLFFRSQPQSGPIVVTEDGLRQVVASLPGVDVNRAMADRSSDAVTRQLADAAREAKRFDIPGTPSFLLGAAGQVPRVVPVRSMKPEALSGPIDELLRRSPGEAAPPG